MSAVKIKCKYEPKALPWGTPDFIGYADGTVLSILTWNTYLVSLISAIAEVCPVDESST